VSLCTVAESASVAAPRTVQPDESALAFNICKDETEVIRAAEPGSGSGLPRLPLSALKTSAPPESCALPDDPEESLAHALDPVSFAENLFKAPTIAPLRSSLKKPPSEKTQTPNDPYLKMPSRDQKNPAGISKNPVNDLPIFSDEAQPPFPVYKESEEEIPIFKEREVQPQKSEAAILIFQEPEVAVPIFKKPEVAAPIFKEPEVEIPMYREREVEIPIFKEPEVKKPDLEFNVFVDEQEVKLPAEAAPAVTPGIKVNIAKEKENARKFSHVEIEEIAKQPTMVPPRRSILPQLNNHFNSGASTKVR